MLSPPISHHEGCTSLLYSPRAVPHPSVPSARHNWLVSPTQPVLRSLPPLGDPVHGCRGSRTSVMNKTEFYKKDIYEELLKNAFPAEMPSTV